jgi:hypothetical protein
MATAERTPAGAEEFSFPDDDKSKGAAQAGNDEGLEVEIVDDTPEKDKGRKALDKQVVEPTDEELDSYGDKVKARIKELTHARHDERRRADTAARERDEAINTARQLLEERKSLAQRYNSGQEAFVTMAKDKAESELKAAQGRLKKAHEDFDTDAIVQAQTEVAQAAMRVEQTRNFRATPVQTQDVVIQPRQAHQESTEEVDPSTLSWQAKNQWFGDPDKEAETSFALGVHAQLVKKGYVPGSDAYFAQIDARMKSTFPDMFEDSDTPNPTGRETRSRQPATVVAPAARTNASAGKVRLTKTQVALAQKLGITPQQYAVQVLKLQENQ